MLIITYKKLPYTGGTPLLGDWTKKLCTMLNVLAFSRLVTYSHACICMLNGNQKLEYCQIDWISLKTNLWYMKRKSLPNNLCNRLLQYLIQGSWAGFCVIRKLHQIKVQLLKSKTACIFICLILALTTFQFS